MTLPLRPLASLVLGLTLLVPACTHRATAAPTTRPAATPPRRGTDVAAAVATLARETSAIRGLAFEREVPVAVQTPAEIAAHLRAELEDDRAEIDDERRIGVALGVLPPGIDLADALSRFIGAEASGYYDPDAGRLVLSASEAEALDAPGPNGLEARATVVHELTHALQHQHFEGRVGGGQTRPAPASDGARARLALLEGDATLVAMEWGMRRRGRPLLGAADMSARIQRWVDGVQVLTEVDVPAYMIDAAELPYEAGALAVGALYAAGGWTRVNAALQDTALRAAEVLHPGRVAPGGYVDVPPPAGEALLARGARRVIARSLGEVELRLYLGRATLRERAAAIAGAWRGDALAVFEADAGLAAIWRLACADEASARAVAQGLAPLAAAWARDGCPGMLGGGAGRCPASITVDGTVVTVSRGG